MSTAGGSAPAKRREKLDEYDITQILIRGVNVVADSRAEQRGQHRGLVARVTIKDHGEWIRLLDGRQLAHGDASAAAVEHGPVQRPRVDSGPIVRRAGPHGPVGSPRECAGSAGLESERFMIDPQFEVQHVLTGDQTGSMIAMSFNEFGHILASKEGGGLLLIYDANGDKIPERVRTYCDKVKNIQGILALNGEVFVTGDGPDGLAPVSSGR